MIILVRDGNLKYGAQGIRKEKNFEFCKKWGSQIVRDLWSQ